MYLLIERNKTKEGQSMLCAAFKHKSTAVKAMKHRNTQALKNVYYAVAETTGSGKDIIHT